MLLKVSAILGVLLFSFAHADEISYSCQKNTQQSSFLELMKILEKPQVQNCPKNLCEDNSISYKQPDSEGIGGWEGKCGQTAAANLMRMHCGLNKPPESLKSYFNDSTPGVQPTTLKRGLNTLLSIFSPTCPKGGWEVIESTDRNSFLKTVSLSLKRDSVGTYLWTGFKRRRILKNGSGKTVSSRKISTSPVAVLISSDGDKKSLHWITVVDMYWYEGVCRMIYNTWQEQHEASCHAVSNWASNTNLLNIKPFTVVRLNQ